MLQVYNSRNIKIIYHYIYIYYTRETPAFGGISLAIRGSGAFGGGKKNKIGVPHSFKNLRRVMRIPNMCLVLKLDNGKVVSIANGQTE